MKSNVTLSGVKLFNIKPLGNGSRFGVKISSKNRDGSYTKGVFLNCKHNEMLGEGIYTLTGFLGDNEYNGSNTIEFIVMTAIKEGDSQSRQTPQAKPMPKQVKEIDINTDEIPF